MFICYVYYMIWFLLSIQLILVIFNIFSTSEEEAFDNDVVRMLSKKVAMTMRLKALREDSDDIFTFKLFMFSQGIAHDKLFSFSKC